MRKKSFLGLLVLLLIFMFVGQAAGIENQKEKDKELTKKIKIQIEMAKQIADGEDLVFGDGVPLHDSTTGSSGGDVTPQWASGGINYTHQYLVARALDILENDKGWAVANKFYKDGYGENLFTGADWPDEYETDSYTFSGHFYSPITGKNYLGQTSPTAKTRFTYWANLAYNNYFTNKSLALTYLGRALHYLGDLSESHHVHNQTALGSDHVEFESYANANRYSYAVSSSNKYNYSGSYSAIVINMANDLAYDTYYASSFKYDYDMHMYLLNNWSTTANNTMGYGQKYMVGFLYQFLKAVGEI